MGGPLSAWPWERLGSLKYMLYAPLVSKIVYSRYYGESMVNIWCHIFIISMLRCLMYQGWSTFSNMLFLNRNKQIFSKGLDFEQIDKEWDWDNFIILQAIMSSVACYLYPYLGSLPLWNGNGVIAITSLHVAVSEPLYYWAHKAFHGIYLFTHYHSLHHSSAVPQPFTAGHATFLEHLVFTAIIGIPILGCCLLGYGSISIIYAYVLAFDMLRCLGHCNVEIVPYQIFEILPILKYIIYTPTYHSLHHKDMGTNFCLFMPLFDALGNTLNKNSWEMYKKSCTESVKNGRVPDFVFLAHVVDLTSALHVPFMFRSYSSIPYSTRIFLLPLWPICFFSMLGMWAKSKAFLVSFYNLRGRLHQTWAVPRFGFQYFLPFCAKGINEKIEEAILRADKLGVKVISLAALNKNEALNGGGTLFVNKHPTLKVRVVHGNTLTAAVTLNEIPKDVTQVFLTASTSKLGRAIALYLCHRNVRVLMLTTSTERFKTIQKEAHVDFQKNLIQVTKYQAANNCKTWIVGKWITGAEQKFAPPGTHFHQFVVPPIFHVRKDCTYGDLAAMRLPEDVEGLGCCEIGRGKMILTKKKETPLSHSHFCKYTMERGVVHACHAGGVVHSLQGWTNHEVGPIDVDKIDQVWEAALKLGFRPVSSATTQT